MTASSFQCDRCGKSFSVRADVLARYPGWAPRTCLACRQAAPPAKKAPAAARGRGQRSVTTAAATEPDPDHGVFTDGACSGNPGPGGWAAVHVVAGEVVDERHGTEPRTTNNRMELRALIEAYRMLPEDSAETIWSDSNLCVQTINEWAAGWERRGWKRRTGPVENLDLVREAFELARAHPRVRLRWLRGHAGKTWNEYADRLATAPLKARRTSRG